MSCINAYAVEGCYKLPDGSRQAVVIHNVTDGDGVIVGTLYLDADHNPVEGATAENVIVGSCDINEMCVESQEWTYGIDNTGTNFRWPSACYRLILSDGSIIEWEQTAAANAGWTPQMQEWGANIQAAADAAGILWFVETRFRDASDPANLAGGGGFAGPPSEAVSNALTNMLWRYVNIQICPGQPVPVAAEVVEVKDAGGVATREPGYPLTTDGAVLGPISKFWLCKECGEEPVWYLEDGVTLAEAGQIPNCWEPCGTLALTDAPPDRECEFKLDVACDNNNSQNTADFTNTITRRATLCNGEQIAVDYFQADPDDPNALIDYELVGDFVDCATGEPVPLPEPECKDIQWETKDGYICDPLDSRFAEPVCWAEGRDECGKRVFEGYGDCPTYYPGKYDSSDQLVGECEELSLGQAANGLIDDTYASSGAGTNTHQIKFSQGGLGNSVSTVIQNQQGGTFTLCRLTVSGQEAFVYDTRNVTVTGGTPGDGNSIGFSSEYQNDIEGCEDAYDAIWNGQVNTNVQSAGYAHNCTRLTFTETGAAGEADCTLPIDPQPTQVSKDYPIDPPKEYMPVGILWKWDEQEPSVGVEYWQPTAFGGSAVAHDNVTTIFGSDLMSHPNAPDYVFTMTDLNVSTSTSAFIAAAGIPSRNETNGTDQLRITFHVCSDEPFELIDGNTNTGERGALLLDGELIVEDTTDSGSLDREAIPPVTIPSGIHEIVVATSDLSAWQGYQPSLPEGLEPYAEPLSWTPMPVFKCKELTGGLVDCDGNPVELNDKDFWTNPEPCCDTTSNQPSGYEGPTAEEIAKATVTAERDSVTGCIEKFQGSDIEQLSVPAGTRGNLISISDTGTGLVYFTLDGTAPGNTPVGPNTGEMSGQYLSAPIRNIDLSQVRFDGSSGASDYTVYYEKYN